MTASSPLTLFYLPLAARLCWWLVKDAQGLLAPPSTVHTNHHPTTAVATSSKTQLFVSTTKSKGSRQIWREAADPNVHRDFMISRHAGGQGVERPRDNLHQHWMYFLRLDKDHVLIFQGITQVHQCKAYFSNKLHPGSTRKVRWFGERHHDDGPWYCRLPKGITEIKRQRILKLLDLLLEQYGNDYDFVYHKRRSDHQGFEDRTAWINDNKKWRADYQMKLQTLLADYYYSDDERNDNHRNNNNNNNNLSTLIWTAIGVQASLDKSCCGISTTTTSPTTVQKLMERDVQAAGKALAKMSPPTKLDYKTKAGERLSKFRQKRLYKQHARDKAILEEDIGPPIRAMRQILEDTTNVMVEHRKQSNSNVEFQELLQKLQAAQKEVERVGNVISKYYVRYETGGMM